MSAKRTAAVLAAAVVLQALVFVVHARPELRPLVGDEPTYHARALAVAAGSPMPPNFVWPPLGEWFLGGIYWLFGPARAAVAVAQGVLLLAAGLLLRRLLLAAGLGALAADVGMALLLLDPQVAAFAQYLWPEVLHLFLALAGALLLLSGNPRPRRMFGAGLAFGFALLAKSLLGPFLPVLAVAAAFRAGAGARARAACGAAFLLGVALVLLPVSSTYRLRYGTWRIATSAGLNAWVGINDGPRPEWDEVVRVEGPIYMASGTTPEEREAAAWRKVAAKVSDDGLLPTLAGQARKQYARLLDRSSFFTDQLPGGRLAPERPGSALAAALGAFSALAWGVVLSAAVVGLFAVRWRERARAAAVPLLFLAYNAAIFLLLHVKTRYRVAFFPALLFFAAAAIADRGSLHPRSWRLWAALLAAAAALAIAFG